jgi:hypothetical protein
VTWAGVDVGGRRKGFHLDLDGLPSRPNQDARDAITAAVTARAHTLGETQAFGPLVVPR